MVVQAPTSLQPPLTITLLTDPPYEGICGENAAPNNLGTKKQLWNENDAHFPWHHNSTERKGGRELNLWAD